MAKVSPVQQIVTTEQSLEQNDNNVSIGNPEAMTQTFGQLNFPPINPENQPQEVEDVNTDNVVDLIQNEVPREISGKIDYKGEPPNVYNGCTGNTRTKQGTRNSGSPSGGHTSRNRRRHVPRHMPDMRRCRHQIPLRLS